MSLDPVLNFAKVELSTGYASGVTSIILMSGEGVKLPDPATGNYNLVYWDGTGWGDPSEDPLREIVRVTGKTADTLTVVRAQEGTADTNKNTSLHTYKMLLAFTKKSYDEISTATTVADTASATTWPLLHEAVTGTLSPKTDAGLTYNAATANLSTTTFTGALTGAASLNVLKAGDTVTSTLIIDPATDVPALQIIPQNDTPTTKFMIQGRNTANDTDKFTVDNVGNIVTVGTIRGNTVPTGTGTLIPSTPTSGNKKVTNIYYNVTTGEVLYEVEA